MEKCVGSDVPQPARGAASALLAIMYHDHMDDNIRNDDEIQIMNPLLIPHVLEKILDYASVEDLIRCRKVCVTWRDETRAFLQKKYIVTLNCVDTLIAYNDCMKDIPESEFPHSMYEFGPLTKNCGPSVGHRSRRVRTPGDGANNVYDETAGRGGYTEECGKAFHTFFSTFGNRIRKLELHSECEIPLLDLRLFLSTYTDNLESLSMTIRYNTANRLFEDEQTFYKPKLTTLSLRSNIEMVPISLLRDFFIMAPNLSKLTCLPIFCSKKYSTSRPNIGRVDFIRVLFHVVAMASHLPPLLNLNNLDINLQLSDAELQGLISKAFPLKYITLGICADVKGSTLSTLLSAGKKLLVRIALNFHPNAPAASYRYDICLPKLSYLSLCGLKGSIAFVKHCPCLKTLVIAKCKDMAKTFPRHGLGPHDLQELFLQWDVLKDPNIVQRITRCFPKLTTFTMRNGNDDVLHEIYLTMPFLQKLTILNGEFTDQGITGISKIVYTDIADSGSLSLVDPGKLRTNMSIATLSNLRKLRLASNLITDVSIFLGIGTCFNLQHLHLECPLLTDHCLFQIAKFPHLINLNLVSCSGLFMEWKIKLREDFRNQGRQVNLELATIEEVLLESQRRALNLPDLSHHFYFRRGLVGLQGQEQPPVGGANGQHPVDPQMDLDSSGTDDDDEDFHHGDADFDIRPDEINAIEELLAERNRARGERRFRRFGNQGYRWVRGGLWQRVGIAIGRGRLGERGNLPVQVLERARVVVNGAGGGGFADGGGDVPPGNANVGQDLPQPHPHVLRAEGGFWQNPQAPRAADVLMGQRMQQDNVRVQGQYQVVLLGNPPNPNDFPPPIPIDMAFLEDIEM